ncbi:unnamed protein product, partial [Lymnaea stagnalis]
YLRSRAVASGFLPFSSRRATSSSKAGTSGSSLSQTRRYVSRILWITPTRCSSTRLARESPLCTMKAKARRPTATAGPRRYSTWPSTASGNYWSSCCSVWPRRNHRTLTISSLNSCGPSVAS